MIKMFCIKMFGLVSLFNGISTFVGYLISKQSLLSITAVILFKVKFGG